MFLCVFTSAASEVPYSVVVKAVSLAGCGEKRQIYCFTREGGNNTLCRDQNVVAVVLMLKLIYLPQYLLVQRT